MDRHTTLKPYAFTLFNPVRHKAQVRLEGGESSIEIEIGIEIDSVQFCASVRLDTDFDFDFDFKWGKPHLGFVHNRIV
jgi:hypothetical protein